MGHLGPKKTTIMPDFLRKIPLLISLFLSPCFSDI